MNLKEIIIKLESLADPEEAAGMAGFGIVGAKVYGVRMPVLRALAKEIGQDHELAAELWAAGSRETRILAAMIDDPALVDETQMETWVLDLCSWDVCDYLCQELFQDTALAKEKALEWPGRKEEFVKRAGFALMAKLALSRKKEPDSYFDEFFPLILREAEDGRNLVKKALSWALRQMGKRNLALNERAVETAREIQGLNSPAAKWLARDVLAELESDQVRDRLRDKAGSRT